MRLWLLVPALGLLLAACEKEPSFDDRFERQKKELASEAAAQQRELDRRMELKEAVERDKAAERLDPKKHQAKD